MQNDSGLPYSGRVLILQRKHDVMKEAHVAVTIPAFFTRALFKIEIDAMQRYESSSRKDPEMLINTNFLPEDKNMGLRSAHIPLILNYVEAGLRQFELK